MAAVPTFGVAGAVDVADIADMADIGDIAMAAILTVVVMFTAITSVGRWKRSINGLQVLPNGFLPTHRQKRPCTGAADWLGNSNGKGHWQGRGATDSDELTGSLVNCYRPRPTPLTMYKLGDRGVELPLWELPDAESVRPHWRRALGVAIGWPVALANDK